MAINSVFEKKMSSYTSWRHNTCCFVSLPIVIKQCNVCPQTNSMRIEICFIFKKKSGWQSAFRTNLNKTLKSIIRTYSIIGAMFEQTHIIFFAIVVYAFQYYVLICPLFCFIFPFMDLKKMFKKAKVAAYMYYVMSSIKILQYQHYIPYYV